MQNYRDILYKDYFSTQLGRGMNSQMNEKFKADKEQFIYEIIPLLPKDKNIHILDLGCGTGSLIAALKENGYTKCIGIDLSPEQINVAHKNGVPEAQQGDLIPFLDKNNNTFDVILGMDIIEHFTKDELCNVLSKIKNALRVSGNVIFRTPNTDAPLGSIYCHGDYTHETLLNFNSAEQLFMALEFNNVTILPGKNQVKPYAKEMFRKIVNLIFTLKIKLLLFASGRSLKKVLLTPNLIITAGK